MRIGYQYDEITDKWNIGDAAADYIYTGENTDFDLPGTCRVIINYELEKSKEEKRLQGKKNISHCCREFIWKRMSLFTDHEFLSLNSNQAINRIVSIIEKFQEW